MCIPADKIFIRWPFKLFTFFPGTKYGPFYGPATIQQTQPPAKWKSLKIKETKLSTSQMLQFCSEEGLTGYCDYSIVPDIVGRMTVKLNY